MTCCFTGHRYFPWSDESKSILYKSLMQKLEDTVDETINRGIAHFICGNAVGVDTWAAALVLKKKRVHPQIFLEIALPFAGHNANESACQRVQQQADLVHVVGTAKNRRFAFFERDRYMVDHSDLLIAVYCKSHACGGTVATMEYAEKQGIEVIEIPVEAIQTV